MVSLGLSVDGNCVAGTFQGTRRIMMLSFLILLPPSVSLRIKEKIVLVISATKPSNLFS